jgi:serine/threonine-protein kinase
VTPSSPSPSGDDDTLPSAELTAEKPVALGDNSFELRELIGRGGMGEVYKAHDPRLGRDVALKILRASGPSYTQSLVGEARAQALIQHDNICQVYGVGQLPDGRPYIALQYIGGGTLRQLVGKLSREQLVRIVERVADALHAAHRHGLVHRDVKPANILVEETPEGPKPYVTDFGLAREVDGPTLTQTGVTKGTPAYMAPEQVRGGGQKIDRRTDVYALGVVLYEMLTGKLPFGGDSSMDVLWRVVHEEPATPRSIDPSIPVDLETITLKCMEKDAARRYPTARAVAEDLLAWLEGNPISARAAGLGDRLARWARKHRVAIGLGALALVSCAAEVGYQLQMRRRAAEQVRAAHEFGQEVERNDAISRYAALLPLHDDARERNIIAANLDAIERRMTALGPLGEGPGRLALGRGYLALDRAEDARRELERAWSVGYQTEDVSYALGLAYAMLYQRALGELDHFEAEAGGTRRAEIEKQLRTPALEHLKKGANARTAVPEYVEALIALHEHKHAEALAKARAARMRAPWLFETLILEGDAHLDDAEAALGKSDSARAAAALEEAGRAYHDAVEMAHSSVGALRGECHRWAIAARMAMNQERSPEEAARHAVAACDAALVVRPGEAGLYADEAKATANLAHYQADHNADAAATWTEARRLAERAAEAAPEQADVLASAGVIDRGYAEYLATENQDPTVRFGEAERRARQALELQPSTVEAWLLLSRAMTGRGDWEAEHGDAAGRSYDEAAQAAERALTLANKSEEAGCRYEIGFAWLGRGIWSMDAGGDAVGDLKHAVDSYERILSTNEGDTIALSDLCAAYSSTAEAQRKRGVDPAASLTRARRVCTRAAAAVPDWAGSYSGLSDVELVGAEWKLAHGEDPTALVEAGLTAARRSQEIDRKMDVAPRNAGELELIRARWQMARGASPDAALAASKKWLEEAVRARATAAALAQLAELHRRRAEWLAGQRRSPDADIAAGLGRAKEALKVNPRSGFAALQAAALHGLLAKQASDGAARDRERVAARASLVAALQFDGNLALEAKELR